MTPAVHEIRLRAMGSDAHIIVVGGSPAHLEGARHRLADLERRWSRFLPESDVSRLNRHAGRAIPVAPDTVLLVERAVEAWRLTRGSFDPTVLGAVVGAGYDRSFEELIGRPGGHGADRRAHAEARHPSSWRPPTASACGAITWDRVLVTLPAGVGFDPGGIGKGLAADLVAGDVLSAGAAGVCVNVGGDVRVAGTGPDGGWTVAVEHPWAASPVALVGLTEGALATSTTLLRRWTVDGEGAHHVVDPATGRPAVTSLNLATVVAGEAWRAEVLATAVLLDGPDAALDTVGPRGAQALTVDLDGVVRATAGLSSFLGGTALPSLLTPPGVDDLLPVDGAPAPGARR